jgi:hypothetical protein
MLSSAAEAQVIAPFETRRSNDRFQILGSLALAKPQGEFRTYVGQGWGGDVAALVRVDRQGWISLRVGGGLMQYGNETKRVALLPTTGRVSVDVNTDNNVGWFTIGPQFAIPTGFVRPYVDFGFAGTVFNTTSSVEGSDSWGSYASTTNANDWSSAWTFGSGVYVPLTRGATTPVALHFGGRYYHGGQASYLREGAITDNPDGSITLHPTRSKTDFILWQLGVSVTPRPRQRR